jgi:hypothetical protein
LAVMPTMAVNKKEDFLQKNITIILISNPH